MLLVGFEPDVTIPHNLADFPGYRRGSVEIEKRFIVLVHDNRNRLTVFFGNTVNSPIHHTPKHRGSTEINFMLIRHIFHQFGQRSSYTVNPAVRVHHAHIQIYDRIALPRPIGLVNRQTIKQLALAAEQRFERSAHKRLTETPRTRQKELLGAIGNQVIDITRFVNIDKAFPSYLLKNLTPYR